MAREKNEGQKAAIDKVNAKKKARLKAKKAKAKKAKAKA